jgi:hypothetical protein
MNQNDNPDDVGPLRRAMEEIRGSTQLYPWLRTRYTAFQTLLAEARRPDWKQIAIALAKLGVTDARVPSSAITRKTWWKVRQDVATQAQAPSPATSRAIREAGDDQKRPPPTTPAPSRHGLMPSAVAFDPDDVDQETTEPEFRPAAPRTRPPTAEQQKPEPRHATSKPGPRQRLRHCLATTNGSREGQIAADAPDTNRLGRIERWHRTR